MLVSCGYILRVSFQINQYKSMQYNLAYKSLS